MGSGKPGQQHNGEVLSTLGNSDEYGERSRVGPMVRWDISRFMNLIVTRVTWSEA